MSNMLISSDQRASVEYSDMGSVLTIKEANLEDGSEYMCQVMTRTPIELTHKVTVLGGVWVVIFLLAVEQHQNTFSHILKML